ncbi:MULTISPECIES: 5'/3'-nucleotidase SurE [Pseudorhizobium]|mgnify:FL=1|jgi:5'-nucleotidase|uniref:5'-nucleotidase SurE n=2 Tax=Pseudorhizobium TaxID=1903858 RepID=A0A7W9YW45_9HYPH|nr:MULTISPECIES: 5'/3'-nucleotidase SurE [Pseudorhizobium]MBB6179370.1 5'-nucleotidase [Pseudorhizobium flavum]CAD6604925.1 5'/3'-nucleotidase SurE [Pseudorhizobium flavum]CAD7031765.1 5'/3'-nucleotidase SurE [Pseudorhizobium halotolerans]
MRILLTNDDGIHAEGLAALERIARQLSDDVWIVAPETDQSGLAHSLTLSEPLRLRKVGDKHFALRGTPTDCVIMGIREVLPEKPDLVLSGVNAGANMADDVTYSGTIAGAIEGTLQGVRSFALSQAYQHDAEGGRIVPWETAEAYAPDLIRKLSDVELPDGTFLNLNFPKCAPKDVQGVQVTSQGKLDFGLTIDERRDGRGLPYYWLRFGERLGHFREGTDIHAVKHNRISVTPLKLDLTDHSVQDRLAEALGFGVAD